MGCIVGKAQLATNAGFPVVTFPLGFCPGDSAASSYRSWNLVATGPNIP